MKKVNFCDPNKGLLRVPKVHVYMYMYMNVYMYVYTTDPQHSLELHKVCGAHAWYTDM